MSLFIRQFLSIFLVVVLLVLLTVPLKALEKTENVCVALVLDESGSMADNDPDFLRNVGAKLFISILDDGDQIGIVRFASEPTRLTPDLLELNNPAEKKAVLALLVDETPDGATDMRAGLAEAAAMLARADCTKSAVALLSDGQPFLEGGLSAGYEQDTLSLVAEMGAPVFGIALTAGGESGLLYRLSRVHPQGRVIAAKDSSVLLVAFLEIVAELKDRTVVSGPAISLPGRSGMPLDTSLTPYINRATFVIAGSKPPLNGRLSGPGGKSYDIDSAELAFAHKEKSFSVFTVDDPAPGLWELQAEGQGAAQTWLILRSRLRVKTDLPTFHPLGEPLYLNAFLTESLPGGKESTLIGESSFTAEVRRPDNSLDAIDRLLDDGRAGDIKAGDGIFSHRYVRTELPGEYEIALTGYKGVVPATLRARVQVVAFPTPEIVAPTAVVRVVGAAVPVQVQLQGANPPSLDEGVFALEISDPDGVVEELPLVQDGTHWTAEWLPEKDGSHLLRCVPQEAAYKGVPYTLSSAKRVNVSLTPIISLQESVVDLGRQEVEAVASGIAISVPVISSSPKSVPLSVTISGVPDVAVSDPLPSSIPPGKANLHLTMSGKLAPGLFRAVIIFTPAAGVEMPVKELDLSWSVYQPQIKIASDGLNLGELRVDRQTSDHLQHQLQVKSTSALGEDIAWDWQGPEGVTVDGAKMIIPAGEDVDLPLVLQTENLPSGSYEGTVLFYGRAGLQMVPAEIPVTFTLIEPPWCTRYCLPVGGSLLLVAGTGIFVQGLLRRRKRPWGVLKLQSAPVEASVAQAVPIRSSFRHVGSMTIGAATGNDFQLSGGNINPRHAEIKVARRSISRSVGHPPRIVTAETLVNLVENRGGLVVVDGVRIVRGQESAPLKNGSRIQLGDYEFLYQG